MILGEKTTGKGYAQVTYVLRDGSALHISTQEYFTPMGKSLAGIGITPDEIVEMSQDKRERLANDMLEHEEDDQLQAAIRVLLEKMGD